MCIFAAIYEFERQQDTEGFYPFLQRPRSACCMGRDAIQWWYSVLDVVGVLNDQDDYTKNRNYWKYLKTKLKKEGNELVSVTNQLKLLAPDGKRRLTDIPWRCIGRFRGHGPDFLAEMTSDCPDF